MFCCLWETKNSCLPEPINYTNVHMYHNDLAQQGEQMKHFKLISTQWLITSPGDKAQLDATMHSELCLLIDGK